jgi:hypothetical protein
VPVNNRHAFAHADVSARVFHDIMHHVSPHRAGFRERRRKKGQQGRDYLNKGQDEKRVGRETRPDENTFGMG